MKFSLRFFAFYFRPWGKHNLNFFQLREIKAFHGSFEEGRKKIFCNLKLTLNNEKSTLISLREGCVDDDDAEVAADRDIDKDSPSSTFLQKSSSLTGFGALVVFEGGNTGNIRIKREHIRNNVIRSQCYCSWQHSLMCVIRFCAVSTCVMSHFIAS